MAIEFGTINSTVLQACASRFVLGHCECVEVASIVGLYSTMYVRTYVHAVEREIVSRGQA